MCNYKRATCKTEIMKVKKKKKKTLTQFLALGFQGQTPDWALREDGGDEWVADARRGEVRRWNTTAVSAEEQLGFVLAAIFTLLVFYKEPQLSVLGVAHNAHKQACLLCLVPSCVNA